MRVRVWTYLSLKGTCALARDDDACLQKNTQENKNWIEKETRWKMIWMFVCKVVVVVGIKRIVGGSEIGLFDDNGK